MSTAKTAVKKPAKKKAAAKKKVEDTLVSIVLDRSGSMASSFEGTIKGFNDFLEQQKDVKKGGKARISMMQFDDKFDVLYTAEDIKKVPELDHTTYVPRGMTALYDAIGQTIERTAEWVKKNKYKDRVVFLIITDGMENASTDYTLKDIVELVKKHEEKDKWDFVFIGANIDTFGVGTAMGFQGGKTTTWTATHAGAYNNWTESSLNLASYRSANARAVADWHSHYEDDDKES
jgi:hypothetical protein